MIQVVARRPLRAGIVKLVPSSNEFACLELLMCAQDCASGGVGLSHQRPYGWIAGKVLVRPIRQQHEDELGRRGPDVGVRGQVSAPQLIGVHAPDDCALQPVPAGSPMRLSFVRRPISSTLRGVISLRDGQAENFYRNLFRWSLIIDTGRNAVKRREMTCIAIDFSRQVGGRRAACRPEGNGCVRPTWRAKASERGVSRASQQSMSRARLSDVSNR